MTMPCGCVIPDSVDAWKVRYSAEEGYISSPVEREFPSVEATSLADLTFDDFSSFRILRSSKNFDYLPMLLRGWSEETIYGAFLPKWLALDVYCRPTPWKLDNLVSEARNFAVCACRTVGMNDGG